MVRDGGEVIGVQGILTDITRLKTMEEDLREANARLSWNSKRLSVLNEIITTANEARDLNSLFRNVLDSILSLLDYDAGGIYIVDPPDTRTASIVYSVHIPDEMLEEVAEVPTDEPPYRSLFIDGSPIISGNVTELSPGIARISGFSSLISVPLVAKGRIVGA